MDMEKDKNGQFHPFNAYRYCMVWFGNILWHWLLPPYRLALGSIEKAGKS
jgi:hypothetical protein